MAADKARFYMEQSLPELQELKKKKIFTEKEISDVVKKRNQFELRVNASGCNAQDYIRYLEFEINLDQLRKKRIKRLGVKLNRNASSGQRRIFFIMDRATQKFYGEQVLWMQYIEYARKEKAGKILNKALMNVLRLHPTEPQFWIFAASCAIEDNMDITEGRSYLQRGLRFSKTSRVLWVEYAKLEMVFIAKVLARRELLGIDAPTVDEYGVEEDEEGNIKLPQISAEDIDPSIKKDHSLDTAALENIEANPALNGAIALAIFDSAVKEIPNDAQFAEDFFNVFAQFGHLRCAMKILEHVITYSQEVAPTAPQTLSMCVKLPLIGADPTEPTFPSFLRTAISRMAEVVKAAPTKAPLYASFIKSMVDIATLQEVDSDICKVATSMALKYFRQAEEQGETTAETYLYFAELCGKSSINGVDTKGALERGVSKYPNHDKLQALASRVRSPEGAILRKSTFL
ncbi:U3 small nucleolar RNA-associated protein 6-domain-containing protein [Tuber indicum]|nr:U3 small nucleolar RNA-associated protein 6-domain-containing protein [Tuber indicum]